MNILHVHTKGRKLDTLEQLETVSYTHLDVYKRQIVCMVARLSHKTVDGSLQSAGNSFRVINYSDSSWQSKAGWIEETMT